VCGIDQRQTQPDAALSQPHAEPQRHAAGSAAYGVWLQPHLQLAPGQLAHWHWHWLWRVFMAIPFAGSVGRLAGSFPVQPFSRSTCAGT